MPDRDKIQALWLNLAMTINALEELGEDVRTSDGAAAIHGTTGAVVWQWDTQKWVVEQP